jgi:sugar/nucleoside kinase (ribokinase family)
VDIVLANEDEARVFTGKKDPRQALEELARRCAISVVKCGDRGSFIQDGSTRVEIKPITVQAVDSTGAGDLYAAGFLYGLMTGCTLEVSGRMGSCVGGKVVEVIGAKMHERKWEEVDGLIKSCRVP